MNAPRTLAMATLALCLAGMLVLPAAAAPAANAERTGKMSTIDSGLRDDLWNVHRDFRLKIYELHVDKAGAVIGVLEEHGCDVTELNDILAQVKGQRDPLKEALENRDRNALKTINQELHRLWQEFRKGFRDCIRACSATQSGDEPAEQAEA
ncbi:MAG: hypothetical protein LUO87_01415 [Methanomicrobiales archaeon]|nr:hypothetical protein [Methanomicrobiales archaeon]